MTSQITGSSALTVLDPPTVQPRSGVGVPNQEPWQWARLRKLARHQMDKLLSLVPEVLRDDSRMAVHKLRVTSRRVEQILDLLYPKLRPRHIRKLRRNVKRCRRAVGELRDCDVLLSLAKDSITHASAVDKHAWEAVSDYLIRRRSRKAPSVFRNVSRIKLAPSYIELRNDLDSSTISSSMVSKREVAKLGSDWGPGLVRLRLVRSLERRWRELDAAMQESRCEPSEAVIHGVRIATKRLRYLVEVTEKFDIAGSSEVLGWLRTVQQAIGEWHDLEVLQHMMSRMLVRDVSLRDRPELVRQIEKLVYQNREIKRAAEAKFASMTRNSIGYRNAQKWVAGRLRSPAARS